MLTNGPPFVLLAVVAIALCDVVCAREGVCSNEVVGPTRSIVALSQAPRVYLIDGFLNQSEAVHLRQLGVDVDVFRTAPDQTNDARKSRNTATYRQEYLSAGLYDADTGTVHDAVLAEIEARIEAYSHVPRDPSMRGRIAIAVRNATTFGLHNVHHDHNAAAVTLERFARQGTKVPLTELQATMIGYLGHVEQGGETVFPCICDRRDVKCVKLQKICKLLYVNGVLSVSPENREGVAFKEATPELARKLEKAAKVLASAAELMCTNRTKRGLKISAKPGRAILFFSNNLRGVADPRGWHGSCLVKKGQKVNWQRFLYAPQYDEEAGEHANAIFEW